MKSKFVRIVLTIDRRDVRAPMRKHTRRLRDKYGMTTRGHVHHMNDAHDRCDLILRLEKDGGVFPETGPQRRRRIHDENSVAALEAVKL